MGILRKCALCSLVLGASFASTVSAQDADKSWSIDLSSDFYTDYMFRGFNFYDGTVVQPSVTMNYDLGDAGAISATAWGSIAADNRENDGNFTEVDYIVGYSKDIDAWTFGAGHIWYTYPHDPNDAFLYTAELYASVGYDTVLSPTLTVYHDYESFDNQYYELGISHDIATNALGEGFNVTPYAVLGFASDAKKVYKDDGLAQVTTGVSSELPLGDITVTPSFNYTFEVDDNTVNSFWSGVSLAYSF